MQNLPYHPIINHFIEKNNYTSYLELGLRDANNTFNHINCSDKTSVDIDFICSPDYVMSTDDFFLQEAGDKKWDLIFIDGSHEKTQVKKDFDNALEHLTDNGTIIMDDINPFFEELIHPNFCHNAWEVFAELRCARNDLEMFGIESSFCGVVRRGSQIPLNLKIESTWEFFNTHRQQLINPLSWEEVIKK
jgi:hypothetical protein